MADERRIDSRHDEPWRISDELWDRVYPILLEDCPPRKGPGRKPADWRRVLNGIVFRMRTGCHWNKLPSEFGDDSTIHRWYQRWNKNGVLPRVLSELSTEVGELTIQQPVSWGGSESEGTPSHDTPSQAHHSRGAESRGIEHSPQVQ